MSHTSIAQILKLDPKTTLSEVQGLVTDVWKARTVAGGKVVQDIHLKDATGAEIDASVWGHEDLSTYKGKEVFINAGNKGKIEVQFDTYKERYKNKLSVSATCTFQHLAVHAAQAGTPAPAKLPVAAATGPAPVVVNGAKVGMAINNACQFLVSQGAPFSPLAVHRIASELIRLSNQMENGDLIPLADASGPDPF
jgi:hypothetical protein